jgi:regulator of cell morphogenesis and NO signaling
MLQSFLNKTVSDIVLEDYRTADVFYKYGISVCCNGKVALQDACLEHNVNVEFLGKELEQYTRNIRLPNTIQYSTWKVDFLIDYIINVHHAYLYNSLPALEGHLKSFIENHQKEYPDLVKAMRAFQELKSALVAHNKFEEEVIFPYIKHIENTHRRKETYGSLFVRTLRKPFGNLEKEHDKIESLIHELRRLTGNYTFPNDACTNYRVVYNKLREFDEDLYQHRHLEDNILFPQALEMERELLLP